MYESKELFKDKDLLRDYQIPVFQDMLTAGNKTLLKAPMDYGKTFLACVYVSYLFQIKQIGSATFSIPNYQMRSKIIDDLHKAGLKDKLIVCLEGKDRIHSKGNKGKGKKRTRIETILKDIQKFKGEAIDAEFIERKWPNANAYNVLIALQEYADIIIVHHSLLKTNKNLRKTDILIVDDGDLMNRDRVFLVKRYEVYQQHLQAMKEDSSDAMEIQDKLKWFIEKNRYNKKAPVLSALEAFIDHLLSYFPDNPDELEKQNVLDMELKELSRNPVSDIVREKEMEGKTNDEKLQHLINQKKINIKVGFIQTANPVKWNATLNILKEEIKFYADGLRNEIEKELNYAISAHLDYRIEDFYDALLDPEFHPKLTKTEGNWSLLEIYLKNGSDFMDVVRQYHKVLWISATANPEEFKGFRLVRSHVDPNAEHKHVTFIKEKIPEVIATLKSHNLFVVTNSGKGAKEFTEKYGCGEILNRDSMDDIIRNAKNGKGVIAVSYVNGIGSRGLDDLAELFDVVILDSFIYRSVMQENGKFYGEDHMQNNLSDTTQIIARIMRGTKDHILLVIQDESEAGKFSEFLKEQNPSWNYADSSNDYRQLLSKIPERTQLERPKTVLRKSVQKLKDGTFSVIYTGKTTADDLDRYPDSLEF
jgi:hypothetical protein